jgi:hypothetical protein
MKLKFICIKRSRFEKKITRLLRIHSSFLNIVSMSFFGFLDISKFELKITDF